MNPKLDQLEESLEKLTTAIELRIKENEYLNKITRLSQENAGLNTQVEQYKLKNQKLTSFNDQIKQDRTGIWPLRKKIKNYQITTLGSAILAAGLLFTTLYFGLRHDSEEEVTQSSTESTIDLTSIVSDEPSTIYATQQQVSENSTLDQRINQLEESQVTPAAVRPVAIEYDAGSSQEDASSPETTTHSSTRRENNRDVTPTRIRSIDETLDADTQPSVRSPIVNHDQETSSRERVIRRSNENTEQEELPIDNQTRTYQGQVYTRIPNVELEGSGLEDGESLKVFGNILYRYIVFDFNAAEERELEQLLGDEYKIDLGQVYLRVPNVELEGNRSDQLNQRSFRVLDGQLYDSMLFESVSQTDLDEGIRDGVIRVNGSLMFRRVDNVRITGTGVSELDGEYINIFDGQPYQETRLEGEYNGGALRINGSLMFRRVDNVRITGTGVNELDGETIDIFNGQPYQETRLEGEYNGGALRINGSLMFRRVDNVRITGTGVNELDGETINIFNGQPYQ